MTTSSLLILGILFLTPAFQETPDEEDTPFVGGASLDEDREIAKWIAKAREQSAAGDFAEAVRILQQVVDRPGNPVVPDPEDPDRRLYRPVSRQCHRIIAGFPPEGLQAYRMAHDGEARRLFEEGRDRRDPEVLVGVGRRFFCSSAGDDALALAGDIYLDRKEYARAIRAWDDVLRRYPSDTDISRPYLAAKMALAASRLGLTGMAREWLDEAMTLSGGDPLRIGGRELDGEDLRDTILGEVEEASAGDIREWPTLGGDATHARLASSIPEGVGLQTAWRYPHKDVPPEDAPEGLKDQLPGTPLVVSGGAAYLRLGPTLVGLFLDTGKVVWFPDELPEPATHPRRGPRVGAWWGGETVQPALHDGMDAITVAFGMVFMLDGDGSGDLVAFSPTGGKEIWSLSGPEGFRFATAPTAWEGRLYAPMEKEGELHVAAVDPVRRDIIWRTYICAGPGVGPVQAGVPVAVQGGTVYALSSAGVVAAVDAIDGELLWISRYPRAEAEPVSRRRGGWGGMPGPGPVASSQTWLPSPPIVKDGRLFIAPADSTLLICLDARTGEYLWQEPKHKEASHLLGVARDLVIAGGDRIFARDVETGKGRWDTQESASTGRGILSEDHIYIPEEEVIAEYGLVSEGKREREFPVSPSDSTGEPFRTGSLVLLDSHLLAAHDGGVSAFEIGEGESP